MATGPRDAGQTQTNDVSQGDSPRPEAARRSLSWPESSRMDVQQDAANQMFRQNSERLRQAAAVTRETQSQEQPASGPRELSFAKDRGRGNYNELKQEHAKATGRDAPNGQGKQHDSGERELSFAKDSARGKYAELKQEQANATGKELSFVKDRNPDLSRGR